MRNEPNAAENKPVAVPIPATDDHPEFDIDPEFENLLPRLTPEESAGLAAQIERDRHVDDLVLLDIGDHLLLGDGHNRRRICDEKGIPYKTRIVPVGSRDAAFQWVFQNQLAKRNLTDEMRAYVIGKLYSANKQKAGGDRKSKSTAQNEQMIGSTAEALAAQHGVSAATARRDADFAAGVDAIAEEEGADEKAKILNGKSKKTKAQIIARRRRKGKANKSTTRSGKAGEASSTATSSDSDKTILELMNKVVELIKARGKTHKGEGFRECKEATIAMLHTFANWQKEAK